MEIKLEEKIVKLEENLNIKLTYILINNEENPTLNINKITFSTDYKNKLILHWGLFKQYKPHEWIHPNKQNYPLNTIEFDKNALQTEFHLNENDKKDKSIFYINISLPSYENINDNKSIYGGLKFVFFNPSNNKWYNNFNQDYIIKFKNIKKKNSDIPDFIDEIIECEVYYHQWTLASRYNKAKTILDYIESNEDINSNYQWILVWLRYSYAKLLDWQRNKNTPPRELSGSLNNLTQFLSGLYIKKFKEEQRDLNDIKDSKIFLIKTIISFLGKGTGNGQAIRDYILVIMHKYKLPRKGKYFYEQWHQKLHNNSTPEDIIICEALLAFLRSNNIQDYWRVLKEGNITKERLASYERNITEEPHHNYDYIPEFENFLNILKSVHSNNDLITMFNSAKYILGDKNNVFEDIINNKNNNDYIKQIDKITNGRKIIKNLIKNIVDENHNDKLRDIIFFDISLEDYLRQTIEKIIHVKMNINDYYKLITYVLENINISFFNYKEINIINEDWNKIVLNKINDNSYENLLKIQSVENRLMRLLNHITDFYNNNIQPKAKYLGENCNIDKEHINIFSEELIRGTIFFVLSILLKKIDKIIREKISNEKWLIISRGKELEIFGKVKYEKNLENLMFEKFDIKTILIVENINGNEEIPNNCVGLIIINDNNSFPDLLAHVSVRARNLKVLFVTCFDDDIKKKLKKLEEKYIKLNVVNTDINFNIINENEMKNNINNKMNENNIKIELLGNNEISENNKKIILELEDYSSEFVGAKSLNTKKLFNNVPNISWLKYPSSFSIPFNVYNLIINLEENLKIKTKINELIYKLEENQNLKIEKILEILLELKQLTLKIIFPKNSEFITELNKKLINFGINEKDLDLAYNSIKKVWASKYNERIFLSKQKISIKFSEIKISILVQKIIPAEYAFVIHTKNPINNNSNEIFAEIVNGMGETLVGAYEGQSFSFINNKINKEKKIKSFQNKSIKLENKGFIFRSDSNMEDIENFSGAGLFDSVPLNEDKIENMFYNNDKIFNDVEFRNNLINKISEIGKNIELLYNNQPQDIEGVYSNGEFYVVQTRPQV